MSNTSDNFERIAEDTMDLLITALDAMASTDGREQVLARFAIGVAAANICKRAIDLQAQ